MTAGALLILVGLLTVAAGAAVVFGPGWALIVLGVELVAAGAALDLLAGGDDTTEEASE